LCRDQFEEIGGDPVDARLVQHGRQGARLVVGGQHRASEEPRQVGDLLHQRVKPVEIHLDGVDGILLARKLEQSGRVAARHAGYDCPFACHVALLFRQFRRLGTAADGGRQAIEIQWNFVSRGGRRRAP